MLLGRVTGTVVAAARDEALGSYKLMVVQNVLPDGSDAPGYAIATDSVGAGTGDLVLYSTGASAQRTMTTDHRPIDATIVAIVDSVEFRGATAYKR